MRADLSTIQQTLTPEAASVLSRSIDDAARRRHTQTTPLHVASALLSDPSGLLRRACAVSHPNSSHPLQCRALELCFSVAIDRLPSSPAPAGSAVSASPPVSNALMAALKRAQAHQRRGCPEAQQQPLLAVKVELDQLVLSILDDPSVSRVMREASFSSTALKSSIELSLSSPTSSTTSCPRPPPSAPAVTNIPPSSRPTPIAAGIPRVPTIAIRAAGGACTEIGNSSREEQRIAVEAAKALEIMTQVKKRNPVIVGDGEARAVLDSLFRKIECGEVLAPLSGARVVKMDGSSSISNSREKSALLSKIRDLETLIRDKMSDAVGVVVDFGDLKWLVEGSTRPQQQVLASDAAKAAALEIGMLLKRFNQDAAVAGRLWFAATATCATFMRCQVYHPNMEADWDLQALPIPAAPPQFPFLHNFSRIGGIGSGSSSSQGTLSSSIRGLATTATPLQFPRLPGTTCELLSPTAKPSMCWQCNDEYERELAVLVPRESEKSSNPETSRLPHWLQLSSRSSGNQGQDKELLWKKTSDELQKKWRDMCARLHPVGAKKSLMTALTAAPLSLLNPKLILNHSMTAPVVDSRENPGLSSAPKGLNSPPRSPVKTDLVLGQLKPSETSVDTVPKLGLQSGLTDLQKAKIAGISDIDSFKRILKGLKEKVSWQPDAASATAAVVVQCKSGNGKQRSFGSKGDTWLLFVGPDKVGKRKMAVALSQLVFSVGPCIINIGGGGGGVGGIRGEGDVGFWGKTPLDQIVEAVRQNPLSVILLEDIDQADGLVQGNMKRAIELGRLTDSRGREVNLGSIIFILTSNWMPEELCAANESFILNEKNMLEYSKSSWQLGLSVVDNAAKRLAERSCDSLREVKLRKDTSTMSGLSLDLNLAVGCTDDAGDGGSRNSSDLTSELDHDKGMLAVRSSSSSPVLELFDLVDDAIVFQPVNFTPLRSRVMDCISEKFAAILTPGCSLRVDDEVADRLVSGAWTSTIEIEDWAEEILVPSIHQLKSNLSPEHRQPVVRLSAAAEGGTTPLKRSSFDGLPATVLLVNSLR